MLGSQSTFQQSLRSQHLNIKSNLANGRWMNIFMSCQGERQEGGYFTSPQHRPKTKDLFFKPKELRVEEILAQILIKVEASDNVPMR